MELKRENFIGKTATEITRALGWWWHCESEKNLKSGKRVVLTHKGNRIELTYDKENIATDCIIGTIVAVK